MEKRLLSANKVGACAEGGLSARGELERIGSVSVLADDSRIGVKMGFAGHLISVGFFVLWKIMTFYGSYSVVQELKVG